MTRSRPLSILKLPIGEDVSGVLIATVWSLEGKPLAERLVFRKPPHSVNVKITADQRRYVPGGKVAVTVKTVDEKGNPISSVVGLSVTDDSVLEMIDKREQAPRLHSDPEVPVAEGTEVSAALRSRRHHRHRR